MMEMHRQLGDLLVAQGALTTAQMQQANEHEARTGESAFKMLLDQGILTEKALVRAKAEQVGMGFTDLLVERPTPDALAVVPLDVARRGRVLPMRLEEGKLVVATAEPNNHLALDEVKNVSGFDVTATATFRGDLPGAIEQAYSAAAAPVAAAPPMPPVMMAAEPVGSDGAAAPVTNLGMAPPAESGPMSGSLGPDDLPLVESAAPVVEAVPEEEEEKEPNLAEFLFEVIEGSGSDLHITSGLPPMIRVHGELKPIKGYRRLMPKDIQQMIYSILTQRQREQFEENLELDISYSLPGAARFRVNIFQQRESLGSVMRMIPFEIKDPDTLGLPPAVKEFSKLRRGMVLVTGITGSGKSTTLAGLIDMINSSRPEHIMTVEDPIEFLHKHKKAVVNQREVGTDTLGFAPALKHVLRQDPDVILVGEMRDLETIQTALTAAETGHLVFGTLHTQDAPQSVDRIIDVFPPSQQEQIRIMLAGTLAGIVSQQLVPTADGKGRAVAAEVLVATPAVRNLIREGKTHQIYTSMQAGGKHGMQVMDMALADLVKKGKVTYEAALERAHHMEEFNRLAGKGGN